jgi:hypothetical protein
MVDMDIILPNFASNCASNCMFCDVFLLKKANEILGMSFLLG